VHKDSLFFPRESYGAFCLKMLAGNTSIFRFGALISAHITQAVAFSFSAADYAAFST
jgi:hypothetical protein